MSYGQLDDFNLNVEGTHETCTNNGMIEMSVTNVTPGAEITYQLFLAPDYVNFIAETIASSFSGLSAGNYRVVATQSLNGEFNVQQADVIINNDIEVLDLSIEHFTMLECDNAATLVVTVLTGSPTLYEIISGPEIRPLQSSNEFSNLPSGTYMIRVFDECNDATTKAYTFALIGNDLSIGAPFLPVVYTSCAFAEISNLISSNNDNPIIYPLTIEYTVFSPAGAIAQTASQTITTGPDLSFQVLQTIDLFGAELFDIEIKITDSCGNIFDGEFQIDPNPKLNIQLESTECGGKYFGIEVINYLPPFNLTFTEPAEFNPLLFNIDYPGPYIEAPVWYGDLENPVPFGDYKVFIEDACGRTSSFEFELVKEPLEPIIAPLNNGCGSVFGRVVIQIPEDRQVASVVITSAPDEYTESMPSDVSAFISPDGYFLHSNLPVGDYEMLVTDNCGDTYELEITIPEFVLASLSATSNPNCNPTTGAVKLSTANGSLVTMQITAAPPTFTEPLPYDITFNINSNGILYMSDLPAGMYTFSGTDICGFNLEVTTEIYGYTSNSNGFSLNRKCGAFDISIYDTDESIKGKTFWLQKFFADTNTWGHPYTEASYVEGSIPNATNAMQLMNFNSVLNIFLIGDFRIIKVFESYNNGNANANCIDIYTEFTISSELIVSGVYNLDCTNGSGPSDVVIDVIGVQPFNFKITSPIVMDNGESNVFSGLASGLYNFEVTDNCGNIKNISVEVGTLLSLARANQPQSMLECRDDGVQFAIFSLVDQTPQVLGNQNPNNYNVTYHLTQNDANTGANPLPDGYTNVSNPQTIYVRVEHKTIKLCYATTSFTVFIGVSPILSATQPVFICQGLSKTLTADAGFSAYEWSTGETTQSIVVQEPGTYTVTVKNVYQDFSCDTSKDFIVTGSSRAIIENINASDWSSNNNSITVLVSGTGDYVYSLDNEIFQTSNTFTDLEPGIYTVYVKDANGCGTVEDVIVLLNYPKYFTPNGDGYNETWQVQFSNYEPDLQVDIFDRFGKFIIRLKGGEAGWDGTYNGQELPSTDYWFVVKRQEGEIYRGHFSLKR